MGGKESWVEGRSGSGVIGTGGKGLKVTDVGTSTPVRTAAEAGVNIGAGTAMAGMTGVVAVLDGIMEPALFVLFCVAGCDIGLNSNGSICCDAAASVMCL